MTSCDKYVELSRLERLQATVKTTQAIADAYTSSLEASPEGEFQVDVGAVAGHYENLLRELAEAKSQTSDVEGNVAGDFGYDDGSGGVKSSNFGLSLDSVKADGDTFEVSYPYLFAGSFSDFAKNPELTVKTANYQNMKLSENSRFFLLRSSVTQVQNSTGVDINFTLDGAPITNLHADPTGGNNVDITFWAAPYITSPQQINHVFYDNQAYALEASDIQIALHKTKPEEIEASIADPTPEDFFAPSDNSWRTNASMVKTFKDSIEGMKVGGMFQFARKDSVLGRYMKMRKEDSSLLPDEMAIETHYLRPASEIQAYVEDLKQEIANSPFNNVNAMKGTISRGDGKAWSNVEGMGNDADKDELLNSRQVISFTVVHKLATYKV